MKRARDFGTHFFMTTGIITLSSIWSATASAGAVTKMVITSPPQTVPINTCSAAVSVTAKDSSSNPAPVPRDTKLFFDQGDPTLKIFSDSACRSLVSSVTMTAGTNSKQFYFKGTALGQHRLYVSTLNYIDASQIETITAAPGSSPTPAPTAKPSPTPSSTPLPTPLPTPSASPSPVAFSDTFITYPTGKCFADGQTFGPWISSYAGYGCNSVINIPGVGNAASTRPQVSTSANETHGGLILGPNYSGDMTFTASLFTAKQIRTGSAPNPWEVGWLVWHYTDDDHFYSLNLKPNGWELGKEDPAYPGSQRYLAVKSSPTFPIGKWYTVTIRQSGNTISVSVNGTPLVTFTDTERPYSQGRIGLYNEDAEAYFTNVSVSVP